MKSNVSVSNLPPPQEIESLRAEVAGLANRGRGHTGSLPRQQGQDLLNQVCCFYYFFYFYFYCFYYFYYFYYFYIYYFYYFYYFYFYYYYYYYYFYYFYYYLLLLLPRASTIPVYHSRLRTG